MSSPSSIHLSLSLSLLSTCPSLFLSLCFTNTDIMTHTHTHKDLIYTHWWLNLPNVNLCCTKACLVHLQTVAPYAQNSKKKIIQNSPFMRSLKLFLISATSPHRSPSYLHPSLSCVASHLYPSAFRGISRTNCKPKAARKMWDGHQHLMLLLTAEPTRTEKAHWSDLMS